MGRRFGWLAFALFAVGCASGSAGQPGSACDIDEDCVDDGVFCNGRLACLEGRCAEVAPDCSDGIACTRDECVEATDRCQHSPMANACPEGDVCRPGEGCGPAQACEFDSDCPSDGGFCSGVENCVEGRCTSVPYECDDGDACTADACVESARTCMSTPHPDVLTNPMRCGTGQGDCVVCPEPDVALHQVAVCDDGVCGVTCMPGFGDRNGDPTDGCEHGCATEPGQDVPDDAFGDENCDGIDGDRDVAIFVSMSGDDANDGLTPAAAVGTLRRAFEIFEAEPTRVQILVASGAYSSSAVLELPDGVGVYGGYSEDFLSRTDTRASILSSAPTALRAFGLTQPTVLDRVNFTTADRSAASEATIAMIVEDSGTNLTLRFLSLTAGRGGDGAAGGRGATGSTGGMGSIMSADRTSGGTGGTPGGGRGASGVYRGEGRPGSNGNRIGAGCGRGGPAPVSSGRGCADGDPRPTGPSGQVGCAGSRGGHGAAGDGVGGFSGGVWTPAAGADGATGQAGGGGGGGASGGGEDCNGVVVTYYDTDRDNDDGDGGGGGGGGGIGGGGGGASVGIRLTGSTLNAEQLRVQTAGGGEGGAGGAGGTGGSGGAGRAGAISTANTAAGGGSGGRGGSGGSGGCGGGGGGGPSVGIWGDGTSARIRELTPITFTTGAGGAGGSSCGNAGAPGVGADLRDAFLD